MGAEAHVAGLAELQSGFALPQAGQTGHPFVSLTAAAVAALSIYDMAKMIDPAMVVERVALIEKTGGKSDFNRPKEI